jgi:hypothetical protein
LAAGCGDRAASESQALAIGNSYLAANNPRGTPEWTAIQAIDMGNRWRLSYNHGGTGGPFIVVVNKRSGEVVHFETEQ